jgi:hypothetical protein
MQRQLARLDNRVGEWEVSLYPRKADLLRQSRMYSAWREASTPGLVHMDQFTCKLKWFQVLAEDNAYEQILHSARMWDTGTRESGPAVWQRMSVIGCRHTVVTVPFTSIHHI